MGIFSWLSSLFDPEGSTPVSADYASTIGAGPDINPASGLPMMDSVFDVAGNPLGTDSSQYDHDMGGINPASGLPLVGDSMIDVAGNPFGTDLSHHHDPFEHHHHNSWSSSSSDPFGNW